MSVKLSHYCNNSQNESSSLHQLQLVSSISLIEDLSLAITQIFVWPFVYLSILMLFTFYRTQSFRTETRYMLFAHTLLTDVIFLILTDLVVILSYSSLLMPMAFCIPLCMLMETVSICTPLTITAMCVDRTLTAILIIWIIKFFCYLMIVLAVRTATVDKKSAGKGLRTISLHMFQLILCSLEIVYPYIETVIIELDIVLYLSLRSFNFITFSVIARAVSPLVYGLRDEKFYAALGHSLATQFKVSIAHVKLKKRMKLSLHCSAQLHMIPLMWQEWGKIS
uniref:G-protein coupled receptors family 1 profile domain-containing protein n=1 Tax=Pygocentrus nattereri TaxID=42514 RepID=A0A3B4D6I5_PYGNA